MKTQAADTKRKRPARSAPPGCPQVGPPEPECRRGDSRHEGPGRAEGGHRRHGDAVPAGRRAHPRALMAPQSGHTIAACAENAKIHARWEWKSARSTAPSCMRKGTGTGSSRCPPTGNPFPASASACLDCSSCAARCVHAWTSGQDDAGPQDAGLTMRISGAISLAVACLACAAAPLHAAATPWRPSFPCPRARGLEHGRQGGPLRQGNLFDRINGEAEAYFPYGSTSSPPPVCEPPEPPDRRRCRRYRMGSPWTPSASTPITGGGRMPASESAPGERSLRPADLPPGKTISSGCRRPGRRAWRGRVPVMRAGDLPQAPGGHRPPEELKVLAIPAVVPGSERYIARSLLGYDFFRRASWPTRLRTANRCSFSWSPRIPSMRHPGPSIDTVPT